MPIRANVEHHITNCVTSDSDSNSAEEEVLAKMAEQLQSGHMSAKVPDPDPDPDPDEDICGSCLGLGFGFGSWKLGLNWALGFCFWKSF